MGSGSVGGIVFKAVILLAERTSFRLSPSLAVIGEIVKYTGIGFKDHILHLNPCFLLKFDELLLGKLTITQRHIIVLHCIILITFYILSCLRAFLLSYPLHDIRKAGALRHGSLQSVTKVHRIWIISASIL